MKRPPKSFVVEHKRRSRGMTAGPASIWSGAAGRELQSLVRNDAENEAVPQENHNGVSRPPEATMIGGELPRPRILEVQSSGDRLQEPVGPGPSQELRRRRPRERAPSPETVPTDQHAAASHEPETLEQPYEMTSAPNSRLSRPSFRERRQAARKALPFGERWKWNLKF